MMSLFGSALRQIEINHEGMQSLDWAIVIGFIVVLTGVLLYCNRYMRNAADFLQYAVLKCAGTHDAAKLDESIYLKCRKNGETSLFNLIKYCLKSRKLVFSLKYTAPAVSVVLDELYDELAKSINSIDSGRLMRHWLKFN